MIFENFYSKGHQTIENTGNLRKIIDDTFKQEQKKIFKRKIVYPAIFLASLIGGKCSSTNNDPPVEKVELLQTMNGTEYGTGVIVGGSVEYVNNGSNIANLGEQINLGRLDKFQSKIYDMIVKGNNMVKRTHRNTPLKGTQSREDVLINKSSFDPEGRVNIMGTINDSWNQDSIEVSFNDYLGKKIPEHFKTEIKRVINEYVKDNALVKSVIFIEGNYPRSQDPSVGQIRFFPDPDASGGCNIPYKHGKGVGAGKQLINDKFSSIAFNYIRGEFYDLIGGMANQSGGQIKLHWLKHSALVWAEGRENYSFTLDGEFEDGYSGNLVQGNDSIVTLMNDLQPKLGLGVSNEPTYSITGRRKGKIPIDYKEENHK